MAAGPAHGDHPTRAPTFRVRHASAWSQGKNSRGSPSDHLLTYMLLVSIGPTGPTEVTPLAAAPNASTNPKNGRNHSRLSFAKITDTLTVPDLLALQTESFDWLVGNDVWKARLAEGQEQGR